jgi:signal transduction histidine kinase/DNA-binding response OmpR family regulator
VFRFRKQAAAPPPKRKPPRPLKTAHPEALPTARVKGSIRRKLLSALIGLIVGLVVTQTGVEVLLQKRHLETELDRRVALMRETLLERSRTLVNLLRPQVENDLASFNFSRIGEVLSKSIEESDLLDYAVLMSPEGAAYARSEQPEAQQRLMYGEPEQYALAQTQPITREYPRLNAIEFIEPIHFGPKPWGVLRLGFSMKALQREIARSREEILDQTGNMVLTTGAIAGVFILIGSGVVLLIATTLSRPLIRLTVSVRELARGNFDGAARLLDPAPGQRTSDFEGEIGLLAHSFIEMAGEIRQSHHQLEEYNRTLEEKVRARTLELEQAYEKLKELDQLKTNFLSTVSHELRTPLTSVLGFARIIQKKFESALLPALTGTGDKKVDRAVKQVMENTQIIVEEGERLTTLINDVLDLAKMEAGRTDWNLMPLRIEEVLERAMAATASLFAHKPVEPRRDFAADLPLVEGDRDRLIQVAINLISNAVKFTDEGSVTCKAERRGQEIVVSVIDTGCGIKPEDQPLVFEKFKQVGDTLTDKPKGTGLGLPICKEIVEHHGGRVWVESELGQGSAFRFSLPLPPDSAAGLATSVEGYEIDCVRRLDRAALERQLFAQARRRAERSRDAARHIVIIDDDLNIRQLLRQELLAEGYRVSEAESGLQGLAVIEADPPDLIILDVRMPHLNGFAVAARLRADPATLDLPIVLHTVAEDRKLSERLGIDCYLTKPVEGAALLGEVRALLAPPAPRAKRILLLDPCEQRRRALAALLAQAGHRVREAAEAEAAVAMAGGFDPHLVVADAALADQHRLVSRLRIDQGMERMFFALLEGDGL